MKKKHFTLLAPVLAAAFLLSACGGVSSPTPGSQEPAAVSSNFNETGLPIVNDKITLKGMMYVYDVGTVEPEGLWYFDNLEEKTNIHVDWEAVKESDWSIKTNLMFASGDYPDLIFSTDLNYEDYGVQQKILVPLDDLIDKYMPIYKERLAIDDAWKSLVASDGQMYSIGEHMSQNINISGHYYIKQVWLDELGLKTPKTVDELTEVLRAFKKNFPDSIPYAATMLGMTTSLYNAFSFWGIPENGKYFTLGDDDVVSLTAMQPGYREALEWLSMIYKEGLLDKECISQDQNVFISKLNESKVGLFTGWRLIHMGYNDVIDDYVLALPVSADGYSAKMSKTMELAETKAFITKANKYAAETARWFDEQLETETMFESYYGPKDIEWFWEDGMIKLPEYDENKEVISYSPGVSGMFYAPGDYYFNIFEMPSVRVEKMAFCKTYTAENVIEKNSFQYVTDLSKRTPEEADRLNLLFVEIDKFMKESITSFILNGVTDQSWEAFQKTLDSLHADEYIKIYQDSYDRYLAK